MKSLANNVFDGILTSECHQSEEKEEGDQAYEDNPPPGFSQAPAQHAGVHGW